MITQKAGEKCMDLSRLYHPITATPFQNDLRYREVPPAHVLLRPWIRCLWGGMACSTPQDPHPVIPDTCSDIILAIDRLTGSISASYCALNDQTFFSASSPDTRTELFAIRFYPWAAPLFMQDTLRDSLNLHFDARQHFPALVRALVQMLNETKTFPERCKQAECILLSCMNANHPQPALMNITADLLQSKGRMRITELAAHSQLSTRQLERLFHEYTGASPKKLSEMIRYQYLWRTAVSSPAFDVQDAVLRFGYADQSHLLRQFKQYHGMTLTQAAAYARSHVGFVQYNRP